MEQLAKPSASSSPPPPPPSRMRLLWVLPIAVICLAVAYAAGANAYVVKPLDLRRRIGHPQRGSSQLLPSEALAHAGLIRSDAVAHTGGGAFAEPALLSGSGCGCDRAPW